MLVHKCDAIVICCIDFRFQKFIRRWTDDNLAHETFDLVGFAGGTKDLETVLKQIDVAVRLHQIGKAVLMHHEECGAYGEESTPERHAQDLRKAKATLKEKYPNLHVATYYIHLDGTFEEVS